MGAVRVTAASAVQHILTTLQAGRAESALQEILSALMQYPGHPDLLHLKAHTLRQLGRSDQAIEAARETLNVVPGNFEVYNMLGNLLRGAGRTGEASEAFRTAIRLKPGYEPAHKNLISLLIDTRELTSALTAAEAYIHATGRTSADAFEALGRVQKARKGWLSSVSAFRMAQSLSPGHISARYGEAAGLIETGDIAAARDICVSLVSEGHKAPQILRLLARAEMELTDFVSAEPHLREAIIAGSTEAVKDYTNLLWMTERTDEAFALLQGAITASVERPAQAIAAFDELLDMERPELVVSSFERLPSERRTMPDFIARLASAKADLGEAEASFSLAQTAYRLSPANRVIAYQFIVSALTTARYDLALSEVRVWRLREPLDQSWIALEADALRMLGQMEAYRRLYDYDRFVRPSRLEGPVGFSSLEDFHAAFIHEVHGSSVFRTHPLGQSARLGIQSPRNLAFDDRPVVRAYLEALHAPVRAYLEQIGSDPTHPITARNTGSFHICGCWSIYLLAGGKHVSHTHPNGWISSAYYMAVPPEAKEDPVNRPGWIKFGEPPYVLPEPAPAEHWVCPEPGSLVLFPAYMWHGTVPISGKAPRVTAPLDVQPGAAP